RLAELADALAEGGGDVRELPRPEHDEGDDQDQDQLAGADVWKRHVVLSAPGRTAGRRSPSLARGAAATSPRRPSRGAPRGRLACPPRARRRPRMRSRAT